MDISFWVKIAIAVVTLGVGITSRFIFHKPNHPIEEIAEETFEQLTGIDIEFSPESARKKTPKKVHHKKRKKHKKQPPQETQWNSFYTEDPSLDEVD